MRRLLCITCMILLMSSCTKAPEEPDIKGNVRLILQKANIFLRSKDSGKVLFNKENRYDEDSLIILVSEEGRPFVETKHNLFVNATAHNPNILLYYFDMNIGVNDNLKTLSFSKSYIFKWNSHEADTLKISRKPYDVTEFYTNDSLNSIAFFVSNEEQNISFYR